MIAQVVPGMDDVENIHGIHSRSKKSDVKHRLRNLDEKESEIIESLFN